MLGLLYYVVLGLAVASMITRNSGSRHPFVLWLNRNGAIIGVALGVFMGLFALSALAQGRYFWALLNGALAYMWLAPALRRR